MTLRILHAVADGAAGGCTTHLLALFAGLSREAGIETHLLTEADSHLAAEAARMGVIVHPARFFRSRFDPALALSLARRLHGLRPALLHAHGGRAAFAMLGARLRLRVPMLYSVHGYHFTGKSAGTRHLGALAEAAIGRAAAGVIFCCAADAAIARCWRLVPAATPQAVCHAAIGLPALPAAGVPDLRLIAFVGRLVEQKNPLLAIEVLGCLARDGYRMRVIGDGPLGPAFRRAAARAGLADRIEMLGTLPRETLLAKLAGAGALLLPSRWEGLPLAAVEAMALGVPVVASRLPGTAELIADGVEGHLAAQGDAGALAAALRRATTAGLGRVALIARARRRVEALFDPARTASLHASLYRALAWGRPHPALRPAARTSTEVRHAA
ncbi:MAG: glycosyltransferase [Alphaproteobacteria bacterium]|nr:glycosyltransferase [Alphaproteobacteria bacterium]